MSIFLGEALTTIFEAIGTGRGTDITSKTMVELGMGRLPLIAKDNTDRNRTSPFAFTGNKFEFRAVGSSQAIHMPNVFVNTAVAEALDEMGDRLEKKLKAKVDVTAALLAVAGEVYQESKAVVFNGDNYSQEWVREAEKRGLPNLKDTPAALAVYTDPSMRGLLLAKKIFLEHEIDARYLISLETFIRTVEIEASVMMRMVDTGVIPAVMKHQEHAGRVGRGRRPRPASRSRRRRRRSPTTPTTSRASSRSARRSRRRSTRSARATPRRPSTRAGSSTRCGPRWTPCARPPTGSRRTPTRPSGRFRRTTRCSSSRPAGPRDPRACETRKAAPPGGSPHRAGRGRSAGNRPRGAPTPRGSARAVRPRCP